MVTLPALFAPHPGPEVEVGERGQDFDAAVDTFLVRLAVAQKFQGCAWEDLDEIVARWVYGVILGLPRRWSRPLCGSPSTRARMDTTSASTQTGCPGQTGSVQRRQGGSVRGASTQMTAPSPSWSSTDTRAAS